MEGAYTKGYEIKVIIRCNPCYNGGCIHQGIKSIYIRKGCNPCYNGGCIHPKVRK